MRCFLLFVKRIFVQILKLICVFVQITKCICPMESAVELGISTCYDELLHTGLKDRISKNHLSVRPCVGRRLSKNVWGKSGSVQCWSTQPTPGTGFIVLKWFRRGSLCSRLIEAGRWEEIVGRIPIRSDQWKFKFDLINENVGKNSARIRLTLPSSSSPLTIGTWQGLRSWLWVRLCSATFSIIMMMLMTVYFNDIAM